MSSVVRPGAPSGVSLAVRHRALAAALAVTASLWAAQVADAAPPQITGVDCVSDCTDGQPRGGSLLLVSGKGLDNVFRAIFRGGGQGIHDVRGRAARASASNVRVRVPWEAVSGRFVLGSRDGTVSEGRAIQIAPVPVVSKWSCVAACAAGKAIRPGSLLLVKGVRLQAVRDAVVYNGKGRADDRRARVSDQRFGSFRLRVPAGTVTGDFAAREYKRKSPARRLKIVAPAPVAAPAPGAGIFPVRGAHGFGQAGARFGAPRSGHTHQGQDVIAKCGTPLVSAEAGTVRYAGYQSAAGNYIVIAGASRDEVYMHLAAPSPYRTRAVVAKGAAIGAVGETGHAQGCHLHFELWSSPGWYEGGKPFDPLPQLKAWDATS